MSTEEIEYLLSMAQAWRPTRRELLTRSGMGLASLALAPLVASETARAGGADPAARSLMAKLPHFRPRAKRVIHLFMNGGPSQVDTFDPKPALAKYAGQELPTGNLMTERKTGGRVSIALQVQEVRRQRNRGERFVSARGRAD